MSASPVQQAPPPVTRSPLRIAQNNSPVKNGGFTYDTVEQSPKTTSEAQTPASSKRWSAKAKAADHYMTKTSPTKSKSPSRMNGRKSFTKSPTDRGQIGAQRPVTPYQSTLPPPKPDLPTQLTEEFKKEPQNYNTIEALINPENFQQTSKKWKELGILYAEDIVKNATSPIDYHLRVAENDLASGFGQVDKTGQLQGMGRECYDFIYEGQFKNNLYHGWGRYINQHGVYWGFFENGLRHGRGKWLANDGKSQDGNWNMGQFK